MNYDFSEELIEEIINLTAKTINPEQNESSLCSGPVLLADSTNDQNPSIQSSILDDTSSPQSPRGQTDPTADYSHVTNEDFISAIFSQLTQGAFAAVCSKPGDPTEGGWLAKRADTTSLPVENNNYFTGSSFIPQQDGAFKVRKAQVVGCFCIVIDDYGTKIPLGSLGVFKPSWLIETSPGNFQLGFIFKEPITDGEVVDQLSKAIITNGLSDPGASGPLTRWGRLPNGINGKEKYRDATGAQFKCRLVEWRPALRYTPQEINDGLKLKMQSEKEIAVETRVPCKTPLEAEKNEIKIYEKNLEKIELLLKNINPDSGRDAWLRVGMGIFYETKGSEEGMALFDRWSRKGKKYKGIRDIETAWRSFRLDVPNPVTIGTLIKMAKDAGADDVAAIMDDDKFEVCDTEVIYSDNDTSMEKEDGTDVAIRCNDVDSESGKIQLVTTNAAVSSTVIGTPLDKHCLLGMSDEIEKMAMEEIPVLGEIAPLGQCTVIFAPPNVGKTLLTIKLLMESIEQGRIEPKNVYYINVDDNATGIVEKLRIAEEYGFHVLCGGYRDFKADGFLKTVESMNESGKARGVIIILDTLKKFTNLMDKGNSAYFANIMRMFVMHGGTVVGLAHTNKHRNSDGKLIPAGTSDLLDDFDCSYVLDIISEDTDKKVVEFEMKKSRGGNSPLSVSYSYAFERGIKYNDLLLSVQRVDESELKSMKQTAAERSDAEIISAIEGCIKDGVNTKMKMAKEAAERVDTSKSKALKVIEKYTGKDSDIHKWSFSRREHGAMVYVLLECPSGNPTDEPITSL